MREPRFTLVITKSFRLLLVRCVALFLMIEPASAATSASLTDPAQDTGTISGRVSNRSTQVYLEGARVVLQPTGGSKLTGRDGQFLFPQVRPGTYTLVVSYTGLETQTVQVVVTSRQVHTQDVELTAGIYTLEKVVVAGEREGNALAVTQQRNAPNVKNVVAADAFGNIADQNIGNLLVRLPGVAEEIPEAEVTGVSIRGISSDMNAVTVDGTRGASGNTGAFTRSFAIDRIPADFIERIEVTKAMTPDMDGDSIGGAINLRTKSPLDRKGRNITYMAGTSWNVDRGTFRPLGAVTYSDIFGAEKRFGLLATSSYSNAHRPRDSVYQNWQPTTVTDAPAYFWMNNLGEDQIEYSRLGVGVRGDYNLSATHRISLNTMYADYEDKLDRRQVVMTPTAAQIRPGWTDTITETNNHPVTLSQNRRARNIESINMVFGGEKQFATSLLDYGANFSHSDGSEERVIPVVQVMGVGFRFDRSQDIKFPTVTQISGPALTDRSDHRITSLGFQDFHDTDTIRGAHINWRKSFALDVPASFKTGLRFRGQERDRKQKRPTYTYWGPDGIVGRNPATGVNDDNVAQFADLEYNYRPAGRRYNPVPVLDIDRLLQHWRNNPSQYPENILNTARDSLQFNGTAEEEVYAAYVMGDLRLGRLDILAGFRVEETHLKGRGVRQEVTLEERARRLAWVGAVTPDELRRRTIAEWSNIREDEGKYRNVLPSVHFKYSVAENIQARLSYSTGIGRPNFADVLSATSVDHDNMRVVAANPDLRAQTANNFDLAVEYYFEPSGFLSAGVFLKEIKDFIYGSQGVQIGTGPDNGFGGEFAGYDLRSDFNGGSARVRGFELAYNQRFSRLPGVWRGLGFMCNYTKLESEGNYTAGGGVTTGAELAGFVPETVNVALTYALQPWEVQLKYSYRSALLGSFNANPVLRLNRFSRKTVDLSLKYTFDRRISLFTDVLNLLDDPMLDNYGYTKSRIRQTQVFKGPSIKAGISGSF
jgi:iron complex outermembrane recepter protein